VDVTYRHQVTGTVTAGQTLEARAPGACNSGKLFRKPALEALSCVPMIRANGLAVKAIR
jgi:hypothetical protein